MLQHFISAFSFHPLVFLLHLLLLVLVTLPVPSDSSFLYNRTDATVLGMQQAETLHHRLKRAPAVWGAPAPDYRSVVTLPDSSPRYLYTLLFVDSRIMEHYDNDFLRAKAKVIQVVEEANRYLIQLNVAIVVLDILPMMRADFSLYTFQEFRNQRLARLADHDFAVLFSYKYAGGLAFVDGMCSPQSVMLCGFFPQEPKAMGGIFFHEIAHLLGVPHKPLNSTVYVPDCECPSQKRLLRRRSIKSHPSNDVANEPGCLKIPGFDHDCTAQQFVNYLHKSRCVRTEPIELMRSTSPICGNSVVEGDEQCDCGIIETCTKWNCDPASCRYRMHPAWLWLIALVSVFVLFSLFSWTLHRRGLLAMFSSCYKSQRPKASTGDGMASAYASTLLSGDDLLRSPYVAQKPHSSGLPAATRMLENGVVVLERPPRGGASASGTLQRPRLPPPPPPKTSIAVQQANHHGYEIPMKRSHDMAPRAEPDSISWKFDSFDSDDEFVLPVPAEPGVPCRPNYPPTVPISRITVAAIHSGSGDTLCTDCSPSTSSSNDVKL